MTAAVTGRPAPCRGAGGGWLDPAGRAAGGLRGPAAGARQECPYALTLGYDRMVAGLGLQSSDLQRLLAGKLVMVGGQFRASNDWVESPVQGEAPGVHYHAMALDNLIEDGAELSAQREHDVRLRPSEEPADRRSGVLRRARRDGAQQPLGPRGRNADGAAAARRGLCAALSAASSAPRSASVVAATWLGVSYAHRSPINWIGITACVLGFLFYATRETLPARHPGLDRAPALGAPAAWRAGADFPALPEVRGGPAADSPRPRRPPSHSRCQARRRRAIRPPHPKRQGGARPCSKLVSSSSLALLLGPACRRRRPGTVVKVLRPQLHTFDAKGQPAGTLDASRPEGARADRGHGRRRQRRHQSRRQGRVPARPRRADRGRQRRLHAGADRRPARPAAPMPPPTWASAARRTASSQ